ncbi:RNA polymerase sigma factor CnrH [Phycisphaerae bacterium RAS1]|nr:RNA polymerase sigma factor CnrH [Phycisphaerae bacterium RAS1]
MNVATTTHSTLLARVAGGHEPAAWNEFCERYGELIRGFAKRRGLQPADCDDIVQDVLLALTTAMTGFQYDPSKGKFRSYLKTIVIHSIFRRGKQKRGEADLSDIEEATRVASTDELVEAAWEEEWRQYHLQQAMKFVDAEFNEADRTAFRMYALEGRSANETAEALGLSLDQVYQAKSRVLKRLSHLIETQVADEG